MEYFQEAIMNLIAVVDFLTFGTLRVHAGYWSPFDNIPDSNFHGAHMGPTWVLSAPGGPHVGQIKRVIRDGLV